jgi:HSP20 family molecular chaperone IbpA
MLWKKDKKCPNCGRSVKEGFNFCPYCGEELEEREVEEIEFKPFSIFEDIEKEFERIDKMFSSSEFFKFPKIRFGPITRGGGISITIHSATGRKPEVKVKTFGDYKKFEPEIKRKLGIKAPVEEVEEEEEKPKKVPKITEEPETKVERVDGKLLVTVKLPGVKSEEDIKIRKLEQSIEVRAFADDKAYFTLVPIKAGMEILEKSFKDEVLKIELG